MRAIQIAKQGGVEELQVRDLPQPASPGPQQVLVKVSFAGVNFIDTYHRSGLYPVTVPFVPGVDGSGTVEAVGEGVDGLQAGDRVLFFSGGGSYAEHILLPAEKVAPVPEGVSLEDAAAATVQAMTAYCLTHSAYNVQPGDWILVHAAAGGTGQLITQLASSKGAHVVGTVSTSAKAELAKAAGAEHVVLYGEGSDWEAELKSLTGGQGVHAVFDGVGAATFAGSLRSLRPLGTLASFGNASGKVPPLDIAQLTPNNVRLMRPSLFEFTKASPTAFRELAQAVLGLVAQGKLKVHVQKVLPLEQAQEAHRLLESRGTTGKLLLKI